MKCRATIEDDDLKMVEITWEEAKVLAGDNVGGG